MNLSIYDKWEQEIVNSSYRYYKEGEDVTTVDLDVANGSYLQINENTCASFSPAVNKSKSLGFKKYADNNTIIESLTKPIDELFLFTLNSGESTNTFIYDNLSGETTLVWNGINNANLDIFDGRQYVLIDYNGIARQPTNHKGESVYFLGKVIQVSESSMGTSATYRIQLDNSSNVVLVHKYTTTEPRILENDHVLVYGTCNGIESYQSVLGGQITLPSCTAIEIRDASNPPKRKPDPILITGCTLGDEPTISVTNNLSKKIKGIAFRVRYYKNDDILFFDNDEFTYEGYSQNAPLVTVEYGIASNQEVSISCGEAVQFLEADKIEVAFKYTIDEDDRVYFVPEKYLNWFSSELNSFIYNNMPEYIYSVPEQEIIDASDSFLLGVTSTVCYPEFKNHYGFSDFGAYITDIEPGSIFYQLGVQTGDIIILCNGVSFDEDEYAIIRAKEKIISGEKVDFVISRQGELFKITVTPDMVKQQKGE